MTLSTLPDALLAFVFSFLPTREASQSCAVVSRRWNMILGGTAPWTTLAPTRPSTRRGSSDKNDALLAHLLETYGSAGGRGRFRHATRLDLRGRFPVSDAPLRFLSVSCPRLRELYLDHCYSITDAVFEQAYSLASRDGGRVRLYVRPQTGGPRGNLPGAAPAGSAAVAERAAAAYEARLAAARGFVPSDEAAALPALEFDEAAPEPPGGGWAVRRGFHSLRALSLRRCLLLTDRTLRLVGLGCPLLERLSLETLVAVTERGVADLLRTGLERLSSLSVDGCAAFGDEALRALASSEHHRRRLRTLSAHMCRISSAAAAEVGRFEALESLDMALPPGTAPVLRRLRGLRALQLRPSEVRQAGDPPVELAVCEAIAALPALTALDLSHLSLSDDGLRAVGRAAAGGRLAELHLVRLRGAVTGAGMLGLVPALGRSLRTLNVSRCRASVTAAVVAAVAARAPLLEHLDCGFCPAVGDKAVEAVVRSCGGRLLSLQVPQTGVTDAGLAAVSRCERLRVLNLSMCAVTDDGVAAYAGAAGVSGLPLVEVAFSFCAGVGHRGLAALARRAPRLRVVLVGGLDVRDQTCRDFARHCPDLRVFKHSSGAVTPAGASALAHLASGGTAGGLAGDGGVIAGGGAGVRPAGVCCAVM